MTKDVVISWSGGKDSSLACAESIKAGYNPVALLSMIDGRGYARSNGIKKPITKTSGLNGSSNFLCREPMV